MYQPVNSHSLIFKPLDLIISPRFYDTADSAISRNGRADETGLWYWFSYRSGMFIPLGFPTEGFPAWTPTLENIWVGSLVCHIALIVSLFTQLKSCACLLYSQAWISRSQKLLKWVEKWGRERMQIVIRYWEGVPWMCSLREEHYDFKAITKHNSDNIFIALFYWV